MKSSKNNTKLLGDQIRAMRESKKQTIEWVAESIKIDKSLLSKIERNERIPTKDQIKLIAKYFNVDEKILIKESVSDLFATKIIEEDIDLDTLKLTEKKVLRYKQGRPVNTTLKIKFNDGLDENKNREIIKPFRPIQYLGSKFKLVKEIDDVIKEHKTEGVVCDLFCGSGVVSHYLAKDNKVISIDTQYYSTVITSALTNGASINFEELDKLIKNIKSDSTFFELLEVYEPLLNIEKALLSNELITNKDKINFSIFVENCSLYAFLNSDKTQYIKEENNFVYEALKETKERYDKSSDEIKQYSYCSLYYGGIYFSFEQSIIIDIILKKTNLLKNINHEMYNLLLASLLSTMSEVVCTVGKQFAQPMKLLDKYNQPKKLLLERSLRDRSYNVIKIFSKWLRAYSENSVKGSKNLAITTNVKDYLEKSKDKIGCFYADPPYTIDHYSRFYHLLETIALYDYPSLATQNKASVGNVIMKGLYRTDRYQSEFCIPSQVKKAFTELFKGTARFDCPLLLSYSPYDKTLNNRPRLLTIEELLTLAKNYYAHVELLEIKNHSHRKLNNTISNSDVIKNSEVLILCKH